MMRTIIQHRNPRWYAITFLILFSGAALISCGTDSNDDDGPVLDEYSGDFIPAGEDVTTSATGSTDAIYNTETREIEFHVEWDDLSSPIIGMHFHQNGPVIHDIEGWDEDASGSVSGTVTFSAAEAQGLAAGDVYTQIHTEEYPGGEVISILQKTGSSNTNNNNNNNNNEPPSDY